MKSLLKFITCGSVDDGKSTLIGHLLYDAKMLFADQERALELDSRVGSRGGEIDYSLLLDGLMAEREQGITIDVAYRFFTTDNRSFIVADTPGHEQYTRNMAVGASFADLAIILVDAKQGVLVQTKRHTRICALMGIRHFILAVNKMDLIDFDESRFEEIKNEFMSFIAPFKIDSIVFVPVSAIDGDNITSTSLRTPWYSGQALLPYLETIEVNRDYEHQGFIMPVQRVSRPDHTFRGFQGQIESGMLQVGQELQVFPSRETAKVKAIYNTNQSVEEAYSGQPVTVQLDREIDVSRGCVLTYQANLQSSDMLLATLLWMDETKLVVGRSYLIKIGTKILPANVMSVRHKIDVNTGKHIQTDALFKNEIGQCEISLSENIVFDTFNHTPALGELILVDRITNMTSACGIIEKPIKRSENIIWHATEVTRELRSKLKLQKPATIWFTGLSGSGKSTLANALEKRLFELGKHTMLLDGDNIRHGLNNNLSFTEADRVENIRRIAEVAKLMNDAGLIVITAFISPFEVDRNNAREIIGDHFIEVYVSTSLETCEQRDIKGLYRKARAGEIENFTGVSSKYEAPENPEITVDTTNDSIDRSIEQLYKELIPYLEI